MGCLLVLDHKSLSLLLEFEKKIFWFGGWVLLWTGVVGRGTGLGLVAMWTLYPRLGNLLLSRYLARLEHFLSFLLGGEKWRCAALRK